MKKLQKFRRNTSGSFTIEASMLFPMILIITFLLIFFSIVIYHKAMLQFEANRIADEMAYTWNNSSKDARTGEFNEYTTDNDDGLYWRIADNHFLEQFGIPRLGGESALVQTKTSRFTSNYEVEVQFQNQLLGNQIEVTIQQPVPLPSGFTDVFGLSVLHGNSTRTITEPTELIRNTDFVVYFTEKAHSSAEKYIARFRED
ncbi:TadE/TadG family type IV pilus assembly protein [Salipaludibacillus daqingensis]|uniref:TadE/TadG family type IV pilus assembly protein n=1 Tax=Salipaludibacillus daqingensis TaxID=3041001 RepID=UPI00247539BC|nr:TadE/TadG family type IV pilus assembly protein [Salipaludibacillus daqingensis]